METDDSAPFSGSIDDDRLIDQAYGYSTKQFLERLNVSGRAALRVQLFLNRHGVSVEVPALRVRSTLDEIRTFTEHEADILLNGTPFAIEVKGRPKLSFTEPENFRYDDISVDTVSGYGSKRRKPLAYVMVSGDLNGGIVLPTFTEHTWRNRPAFDKDREIWDNFYFADKVHFANRRRWLIGLCQALQGCSDNDFDPILRNFGFDPQLLRDLYPK